MKRLRESVADLYKKCERLFFDRSYIASPASCQFFLVDEKMRASFWFEDKHLRDRFMVNGYGLKKINEISSGIG